MSDGTENIRLNGLPQSIVDRGLLSEFEAQKAVRDSQHARESFIRYAVTHRLVESMELAWAVAEQFGFSVLDLSVFDFESMPLKVVDEKLISKHRVLPLFQRDKKLFVGVSDPVDFGSLDEIKFHTGMTLEMIIVPHDQLQNMIDAVLERHDHANVAEMLNADEDLDNIDVESGDSASADEDSDAGVDAASDQPIIRYVNKILLDAINKGASDIHFEPYEKTYRVRYRQDGLLVEVASPPTSLATRLAARIKVMAQLNIAEKRVPQDGRVKMRLSKNKSIDFRVNTCPTLFGEKIVLRILDPANAQMGIENLGFDEKQRLAFESAIRRPYGMILVTGPTGSGKTVTLYTALNLLNNPETNISTAEDPVEMGVPGINQVNINTKTGLTFASALRAFLRQDPDIIMVGEIRDLETAEISIKAAQTGHLVFSTLHTNDAPQTLSRLANMGVPSYNIANAVNLIMAQRLARRLCKRCKSPVDISRDALLAAGFLEEEIERGLRLYGPVGCDQCSNGYKGRVGIFQVMPISTEMGRLIMDGANAMQLADQSRKEGVADLRRNGLDKVKSGLTSLEEIDRVTKE